MSRSWYKPKLSTLCCREPAGLWGWYLELLHLTLGGENIHWQYVQVWVWLHFNKTLFIWVGVTGFCSKARVVFCELLSFPLPDSSSLGNSSFFWLILAVLRSQHQSHLDVWQIKFQRFILQSTSPSFLCHSTLQCCLHSSCLWEFSDMIREQTHHPFLCVRSQYSFSSWYRHSLSTWWKFKNWTQAYIENSLKNCSRSCGCPSLH